MTQREMVKTKIYVYHRLFDDAVVELGKLGVLHQVDAGHEFSEGHELTKSVEPSERYHTMKSLLNRAETLLRTLELEPMNDGVTPEDLDEESVSQLIGEINEQLDEGTPPEEISGKSRERLRSVHANLRGHVRKEEFKAKCVATEMTRVISGWVPLEKLQSTMEKLRDATGGKMEYSVTDSRKEDSEPPSDTTFPTGSRLLRSLSKLTVSFSSPSYWELDPTIFQAITYPLFFGLMFGDAGHGLLLFIVGLGAEYLRRKGYRGGDLVNVVVDNGTFIALLGLAAAVIGAVNYGVVFGSASWGHELREILGIGFLNSKHIWEIPFVLGARIPVVFEPFEEPLALFKLSIVIGALHITAGLLISIGSQLRKGEKLEAFVGPGTWLLFYLGGVYLLFMVLSRGVTFAFSMDAMYVVLPPIFLMFASRALLHGGMGINHALESLLESLSHTISYSRILAMTMIHEILSLLFLGDLFGFGFPLNLITVAVGSIVILLLEGMLSTIQTIRLHWVEWFSKFYAGGGTTYSPFSF